MRRQTRTTVVLCYSLLTMQLSLLLLLLLLLLLELLGRLLQLLRAPARRCVVGVAIIAIVCSEVRMTYGLPPTRRSCGMMVIVLVMRCVHVEVVPRIDELTINIHISVVSRCAGRASHGGR